MKHPYADILVAIATGEEIEYNGTNGWRAAYHADVLGTIARSNPNIEFRIKPRVILINGHEVPEPLRVKPRYATTVYLPIPHDPDFYDSHTYDDSVFCKRVLNQGLFHSTKEAAIKHAEALISFTKVNKE